MGIPLFVELYSICFYTEKVIQHLYTFGPWYYKKNSSGVRYILRYRIRYLFGWGDWIVEVVDKDEEE